MLGALIGDIIGSVFERAPHKSKEFDFISEQSRFTDDSVLTVATADALLHGYDYRSVFKYWGRSYPNAGYGQKFYSWCLSDSDETGESYGNGSAMRVSSIGWVFDNLDEVIEEAKKSAAPSHSHPEGIKGACAVAAAVFLARSGKSKGQIRDYVAEEFGYDLGRSLESIRPEYTFDSSCQGSVPEAIIAFLESESFEEALCNAVSLGGDSDTQACIAGAIAEAFYGPLSKRWVTLLNILMPQEAVKIVDEFNKKYLDSRYNFFCCGQESTEGRPSENGMPYDLLKLNPGNCRWWVKELGMQDEIWAFVTESETPHEASVYFSTDTPVIFDQLCFRSFEDAFIALNRNGFDLFFENYYEGGFGGYSSSPRGRFRIEPHPIFSSGKHWV